MKRTGLLILISVIILSYNSCTEKSKNETKLKPEEKTLSENFDWLLGNWKRNNEEAGKETFEVWKKNNNSEYSGIGYTMQDNDTIKQEKIKLKKLDEKWILEVQPQDEPEPITFHMTSFNEQEFICENPELDFPNKIKYWKNGDKINASVSGSEMEIPFEFERIK
ncbi:MAG: DUF6265 family protein [Bacteroidota bacterium]